MTYAPRTPSLPLPGRPCRVRWLEPLPEGWSIRSDGTFFLFCRGGQLSAFVPVLLPRDQIRTLLQHVVAAPIPAGEDQQGVRLMAKVTADLWGHPMGRVMLAVGNAIGLFLLEALPPAERGRALLYFFEVVAASAGAAAARVQIMPTPDGGKAH